MGLFKGLILTFQFHFGQQQAFVIAVKFVDFEGVSTAFHKITPLVYHSASAEQQQLVGLLGWYLGLELLSRQATIHRTPFYCKVCAVVALAYAHRSPFAWDVALHNMTARKSHLAIGTAFFYQEFPFYFLSTHLIGMLCLAVFTWLAARLVTTFTSKAKT